MKEVRMLRGGLRCPPIASLHCRCSLVPTSLLWPSPQPLTSTLIAQQEGKPIKQCALEVKECNGLRNSYAACKRGQVDARSRLRGNKGY